MSEGHRVMSKKDRVTGQLQAEPALRKPSAGSEPVMLVTQHRPSHSLSPQTSGAQQWCDCQRRRGSPWPGCQQRSHLQGPGANGEEVGARASPALPGCREVPGQPSSAHLHPGLHSNVPSPEPFPDHQPTVDHLPCPITFPLSLQRYCLLDAVCLPLPILVT